MNPAKTNLQSVLRAARGGGCITELGELVEHQLESSGLLRMTFQDRYLALPGADLSQLPELTPVVLHAKPDQIVQIDEEGNVNFEDEEGVHRELLLLGVHPLTIRDVTQAGGAVQWPSLDISSLGTKKPVELFIGNLNRLTSTDPNSEQKQFYLFFIEDGLIAPYKLAHYDGINAFYRDWFGGICATMNQVFSPENIKESMQSLRLLGVRLHYRSGRVLRDGPYTRDYKTEYELRLVISYQDIRIIGRLISEEELDSLELTQTH